MRKNDCYNTALLEAIRSLKGMDLEAAKKRISDAAVMNMDAPEPHNLRGILCEISGDDQAARKHYRAAYALDPTYKPACRNLERLVIFEWGKQRRDYDFGGEVLGIHAATSGLEQ